MESVSESASVCHFLKKLADEHATHMYHKASNCFGLVMFGW